MRTIESDSTGQKFHGMTVKEFREVLRSLPPDMLIVGRYEGDHIPVLSAEPLRISGFPSECLVLDVDRFAHYQKIRAIESDE